MTEVLGDDMKVTVGHEEQRDCETGEKAEWGLYLRGELAND